METMVSKEKIDRINQLARKKKEVGLTAEEAEEQQALREEYLANFRVNFKSQLEQIKFIEDMEEESVETSEKLN